MFLWPLISLRAGGVEKERERNKDQHVEAI